MGFNAKLFEVVVYPESFNMESLPVKLGGLSGLRHYAYCVHDRDEGKKDHCHIMLRMNDTYNSDNVSKWFDVSPAQVERCKGKWADMLAYLIHANASEKFQYGPEIVVSNFDWKTEAEKSGKNGQRLSEIIEGIVNGQIRKYNLAEHVTGAEYVRHGPQMARAFEYRIKTLKMGDREMETYYIWGESGSGKTTFAKTKAVERGYSFYISSGSNDILDGYEGQDCLILDDLRPSCMGLSDLLKMLDPNTASTVKSRYYNKILECKLVIITTTMPMETFFHNVFQEEKEPLKQLERRCSLKIHMTKERLIASMYNPATSCYINGYDGPNFVLLSMNVKNYTSDEIRSKMHEVIGSAFNGLGDLDKYILSVESDPSIPDNILKVFPGSSVVSEPDLFPEKEKIPF